MGLRDGMWEGGSWLEGDFEVYDPAGVQAKGFLVEEGPGPCVVFRVLDLGFRVEGEPEGECRVGTTEVFGSQVWGQNIQSTWRRTLM